MVRACALSALVALVVCGCGSSDEDGGDPANVGGGGGSTATDTFGELHDGEYHLGPVDFAESEWHNA